VGIRSKIGKNRVAEQYLCSVVKYKILIAPYPDTIYNFLWSGTLRRLNPRSATWERFLVGICAVALSVVCPYVWSPAISIGSKCEVRLKQMMSR
jgi:hypothetical protein